MDASTPLRPDLDRTASVWEACRPHLVGFAARMVNDRAVAEELVQEAGLRLVRAPDMAEDEGRIRAWLFRVVTRLALDHVKRHSTWREISMVDLRATAERDTGFVAASAGMRGSPELGAIAREHLLVCFSCTLRNLTPRQAAALLLKEVYGLTVDETAEAVQSSYAQVKNWLQEGRATLEEKYSRTCALVARDGACHQCVELDTFFNSSGRDPLKGTAADLDARLDLLREHPDFAHGPWHERLIGLVGQTFSRS